VRSIDPAEEDFADLEPLAAAIGRAQVVQLGEPSHGAGSAFSAKGRLVKFLHARLGFDVLIWESGLYDVSLAQAAMRAGEDPVAAAGRGIFALWAQAAECRPLFEYIGATQSTSRPMEMAGFDLQVTADGSTARFADDLRAFVDALGETALRARAAALAEPALAARSRLFASRFRDERDLRTVTAGAARLRALILARRSSFDAIRGRLETEFMVRALGDMAADAALRFESARAPQATTERESRRDALNAANLIWLLRKRYAGRKAVIWAHNAHVMAAGYAPGFHDVHLPPRPGDMVPTGALLRRMLGARVYTLGLTAYEGEEGFATGGPRTPIPPAPQGSLEARLHDLSRPYAFVNLRGAPPSAMRAPKFETVAVADPGGVYDGVLFIDRMFPATRG
ncbi:MAG: erythromycin esterase family protein, partial [Proteobacteria bacterium]|nr:erythromycin esterase family protein [Pseudomonadota bacterium]